MDKEKKEIGMEKLIELLNEYEIEREEKIDLFNDKEKPLWEWYEDCTGDLAFEPIDSKILNGEAFSGDTGYSVIISKSYGFIKWLVENDKIDIVKVYENLTNYEIEIRIRAVKELLEDNEEDTIAYLKLLMLLAIQDEPIRFLCEILK